MNPLLPYPRLSAFIRVIRVLRLLSAGALAEEDPAFGVGHGLAGVVNPKAGQPMGEDERKVLFGQGARR